GIQSLTQRHELLRQQGKTDPDLENMIQLEKKLRQSGVAPRQKEAKVELGGKSLTEEEFNQVRGDRVKINDLLLKKYGVANVMEPGTAPAVLSDLLKLNKEIWKRMGKVERGAEQFLTTGGGEKAMRQKVGVVQDVGKLLKPEEFEKIKGNRDEINKAIRKR